MRVAHLVYRFPCLSEPFIMDQITGLVDAGHEVGIYADVGSNGDPVHPQVDAYRLMEKTRFLARPAVRPHARLKQAIRAVMAKPALLRRVVWREHRPLGENILQLAKLRSFVDPPAPRYDVVHCQFGEVGRSYWRAKHLWKAKLVVSFRGHDFSTLPRLQGNDMYQELFREADAVMAVCDYAARRVQELGCPRKKITVHYSGTDVQQFAFHERQLRPGEEVRLLTVARLEESKGIEYALRAVAELVHRHGLPVHYGIAGNGSLETSLKELAANLKIADRVTFHGPLSRPAVRELLDQHHVFILASVTDREGGQEGIPGSVREAMATGMPVASTWHSGIPELVTDGVSGCLVPERDATALAAGLQALITKPERWGTMGRAGREQVERRFEINHLNRRLHAFYRHVLDGGVPADFDFQEAPPARELAAV